VVILDFWTIWSAPCRAELPTFVELQKKYNKDGLVIIGISVDQGGVVDVKPFSQQEGLNYRILLADEKIATAFGGIPAIPTTFVIDEDGRIASKHVGLTPKREFDHEAKSLLGL
jgi:thiol-disulfide isomerase/thioredoxin